VQERAQPGSAVLIRELVEAQPALQPFGRGGIVESGNKYDNRIVQELLAHRDVSTTMIYTQVLNRGPAAVRSPMDRLLGGEGS